MTRTAEHSEIAVCGRRMEVPFGDFPRLGDLRRLEVINGPRFGVRAVEGAGSHGRL